jgi:uncharacterized protein
MDVRLTEFFKFVLMDGSLLVGLFLVVTWLVVVAQQRVPVPAGGSGWASQSGWRASFAASLGGVVTPFCSCSTIPVLTGMLRAGVAFAPSFSFLVASPVINEGVLILLFTAYGPVPALVFLVVGLVLTSAAGVWADKLGLARHVVLTAGSASEGVFLGGSGRRWPGLKPAGRMAWMAAVQELRKVAPYLAAGLIVGGLIYGLVPKELLMDWVGSVPGPLLYLLCAVMGVPLYVSPMSAIPIGLALLAKGFPVGPLVTLLVAAVGTSLPEMLMLLRMFKFPLVLAHTLTVVVCALVLGAVVAMVVQQPIY